MLKIIINNSMDLLSSIKQKLIDVLQQKELGIYSISKKLDISISETWRQMKQLEKLKVVESIKKGEHYKIFKLNQSNPICKKLLELKKLIDIKNKIVELSKNQDTLVIIDKILHDYYLSSSIILNGFSWDIPLDLNVIRIISTEKEKEKVQLLQNYIDFDVRCSYLSIKNFKKMKFYKDNINLATLEQAIIDALASDFIDEIDFGIQALYLADIDYRTLSELAHSQYCGKTVSMIRYAYIFARTFSLNYPVSIFYDKKNTLEKKFKNRVLQNFYRIFLGNGIAEKIYLY
ncbi:MAG: hypothetical protein ACTSO9_04645 [Candidatus Helarchaeota archaeon]